MLKRSTTGVSRVLRDDHYKRMPRVTVGVAAKEPSLLNGSAQIFMLTCQILSRLVRLFCCYLYGINWARTRKISF